MSLTCILIDDESIALASLAHDLKVFKDRVTVLAKFRDPRTAVGFLGETQVDAVFLDVNMPGMTGIEFLELFPQRDFDVIFTTAYSEYALEAFKSEAIGYLVKPIDPDELEQSIIRLEKNRKQEYSAQRLESAIDLLSTMEGINRKIKFSVDKKIVLVEPQQILYCASDGNYCRVILEDGQELFLSQKLKQVADLLPDHLFFRVHNSFLINLQKVKEFHKSEGYVILETGDKIPVSRQKRNEILDKF